MSKQVIFAIFFASKSAMCDQAGVSITVSTVCIGNWPIPFEPEKTGIKMVGPVGFEPTTKGL